MTENLIVYVSANGRDQWHPVKPEEVPAWVKAPEVMARLVSGEECMDCETASSWYRAVRVEDLQAVVEH